MSKPGDTQMFEVIAYAAHATYTEMVEASSKEDAVKKGHLMMKAWLPKGVKILKWVAVPTKKLF